MGDHSFRQQIAEDIAYYQTRHPHIPNIKKDEWAFNYWVLDKLFSEDEDAIEGEIVDYSDHGIDCYVWHEDSKDLYLIQNKYYSEGTQLGKSYFNGAVQDAYGQLLLGSYTRSAELQKVFSKYHDDPSFYVYHYFYVTNNDVSPSLESAVKDFNERFSDSRRFAKVFYLDDIQEAFYGKPIQEKRHFTATINTVNKGTVLNVDSINYGLGFDIDAKYIMLPVTSLFEMLEQADNEHYPIFDANIREYLGAGKAVNKRIIDTLKSESERRRFFFYNNGITIICSGIKMGTTGLKGLPVTLNDPQIVNGCQTVSSIQYVLSSYNKTKISTEFSDVYVMAKVLVIPDNGNDDYEELRKLIVRYNNSQNSIDEKSFAANQDLFKTIQKTFENYGFLVLLKQSDSEKYSNEYKHALSKLLMRADEKLKQFGLSGKLNTVRDFMVPLDKLLQVLLAFSGDAQQAFQKKGSILKVDSSQWTTVTEAIRNPDLTTHALLDLYLLFLRSEMEKSINDKDGKIPITWYLIEGFSAFECKRGDYSLISPQLSSPEAVNRIIKTYKIATSLYMDDYLSAHPGQGYNAMIKEKLDIDIFSSRYKSAKAAAVY